MMLLRNGGRRAAPCPDDERVRLLIVEDGAASPGAYLAPGEYDEIIVLRQAEGEAPIDLFVRTCVRIASLEHAGKRVSQAVIAVAPSFDPQLSETRRMLGLTVLSHVYAVRGDAELVLGMEPHAADDLRADVMALVESLVLHPGSRHAPIRVRFAAGREMEQAPPTSGIHPCSGPVLALARGS